MNHPGNTSETAIIIWFVVAGLIEISSSISLLFWLRRHGVKLIFGLRGTPGYLEYAYIKWCRSQGCSWTTVVVLRIISIINLIAAGVVFIVLVVGR
jgi:hypothetical protein